jgi:prephenate dehydrogenase
MSVGIIGMGRFGALLVRHFAKDFPIRVYDLKPKGKEIQALGAFPATLREVCRQEVIIPCVPIAAFEGVLSRIRSLIREDSLLIDVCSVKEYPVWAMKRILPRNVELLATHPNFGPDSAAVSLTGHKVVVCRVRIEPERYRKFKRVLEAKGLEIIEMSPRKHDRSMASSLILTHFIGRTLIKFRAKPTGVDTEGYKRLLRILQMVQNDSWQLFEDMNCYNAFAGAMRRKLLEVMRSIDKKLPCQTPGQASSSAYDKIRG